MLREAQHLDARSGLPGCCASRSMTRWLDSCNL